MRGKKIAMLGPVYPYKGGIAHYTSLMYQQLSKYNKVWMISYSLQYPKILYPGRGQKDDRSNTFQIHGTKFLLNTVNPVSYHAVVKALKRMEPDLLIIQWWHPFFAPAYRYIAKKLKRHMTVLFVCHNVLPHEDFPFSRILAGMALRNGLCFLVHSKEDEKNLRSLLPDAVYQRTVHPTYRTFRYRNMDTKEARKRLKINSEKQVLLFFGFVRKYKGLKYILEAMPAIHRALPDCELLIAGDFFGGDKEKYLVSIKKLGIDRCIRIFDGYIPDSEVEKFFMASDLVVLPYESATQSGIVQIAFGFEVPVIVTDVGGLSEVVTDGKTGYVVEPRSSKDLGERVICFFQQGKKHEFQEQIRKEAGRFSWDSMENVVGSLYERANKRKTEVRRQWQ